MDHPLYVNRCFKTARNLEVQGLIEYGLTDDIETIGNFFRSESKGLLNDKFVKWGSPLYYEIF